MQEIDCNVVKDLLPLYTEGLASESSKKIVEEHIEGCTACKMELENEEEVIKIPRLELFKSMKKKLNLKMIISSAATVLVIVYLAMISFVYMNSPIELSQKDAIKSVETQKDGKLIVYFKNRVADYVLSGDGANSDNNHIENEVFYVRAYTTLWNIISSALGGESDHRISGLTGSVYYITYAKADKNGMPNYSLIYGTDQSWITKYERAAEFEMEPHHTPLNYMYLNAILAFVLLILHRIVRKQDENRVILKLGLIPLSYAVSTVGILIFVTHTDFTPAKITWVFSETLLLTFLIYGLLYLALFVRRKKKEVSA